MMRSARDRVRALFAHPALARHMGVLLAVAFGLRLLLFMARGDYIAFDEGYYLLLGDNLWSGRGLTLNGLPHTTLSPLYPALAGGAARLTGDLLWGGRWVSLLVSTALLVPAFALFRRIAGRVTALAGCWVLAVAPALISFVSYWAGRDLYVGGSEPLFHLLLFSSLALFARRPWRAFGLGAMMGAAYLARPEALLPATVIGAALLWPGRDCLRSCMAWSRGLRRGLAFALGLAMLAAPYIGWLHQVTGTWTLTGRGVAALHEVTGTEAGEGEAPSAESAERWRDASKRLLWGGSEMDYIRSLYSLDRTGLRLASSYWGVPPGRDLPAAEPWEPLPPPEWMRGADGGTANPPPSDLALTARTMGVLLPPAAWLLVLVGLVGLRRRDPGREWLVAIATLGTSVAILALVHVDARNHLLLVPLLALYVGGGALSAGRWIDRRLEGFRPGYFARLAVGLTVVLLSVGALRQAWLGLTAGSPHHLVGHENRLVGASLQAATDPDQTIMSWHPAVAIFAERDWRVLPYEPLPQVVRYARYRDVDWMVLSVFYPSPIDVEDVAHYVALQVPDDASARAGWRVRWTGEGTDVLRSGALVASGGGE